MIGLAYFAMIHTFREISAGPLNPAIVIAQIMWQTTTFKYQPGFDWNHWTGEYATMYIMGPILGGLIAGNFYNYLKQVEFRLPKEKNDPEFDDVNSVMGYDREGLTGGISSSDEESD